MSPCGYVRLAGIGCCALATLGAGCRSNSTLSSVDAATDLTDGSDSGVDPETWAPPNLIAERLSLFLWNQPLVDPGIEARVAAAASASDVATIATDMLSDPRARDGIGAFFSWWLRLADLKTQPKDDPTELLTADVRAAMTVEAPNFGAHVVLDGDAKYQTLMTAPYTFMNDVLAAHYGVQGIMGSEMRQVPFDTSERIGLLGEAGVLARYAAESNPPWPPRRYWLMNDTLFCEMFGRVNAAITVTFVPDPTMLVRQQILDLTSSGTCPACHTFVNPLSFPFLKFNTFGQFSEDGPGGPFDTSAVKPAGGIFPEEMSFADQPDLVGQLVARADVRRCIVSRWIFFAVERPSSRDASPMTDVSMREASLDQAAAKFETSQGDLHELLIDITTTPAFLQSTVLMVSGTDAGID